MNPTRILLALLAVMFASTASIAATNLDVLIVFSDDSGLSTSEKVSVAASYQAALTSVYSFQLEGDQTVEVWPLFVPEMSYTAANKSNAQALQWLKDQNALPISPLSIAREALGSGGADLILMVLPGTTDNDCGAALAIPILAGTYHNDSNAFAIVVSEESDPDCLEEITVPHEIGHLLYAEHEVDTNGDNLSPDPSNHAIQSTASNLKSLMWDGLNPNSTDLLSGYLPNMTSSWADNVEFMSSKSFDIAAAYRPKPQAPSANVYTTYLDCPFVRPNVELSWYSSESSIPNQTFIVEKDRYMNGNWLPFVEGDDDCVITVQPAGGILYRVKIIVEGMLDSVWTQILLDYECEGGGRW